MSGDTLLARLGVADDGLAERLLYLVGPPRSGTTIITRAIGCHPDILELRAPESMFVEHVWRYRDRVDPLLFERILLNVTLPPLAPVYARLDAPAESLLRDHVATLLRSRDFGALYRLYPVLARLDASPGAAGEPPRYWKDKSTTWLGVEPVERAFPEARFVFIFRDPRDTLLSQSVASARQVGRTGSAAERAQVFNALAWRRIARCALALQRRRPGNTLLVSYERFVEAPAEELSRIYGFLGLDVPSVEELERRLGGLRSVSNYDRSQGFAGISGKAVARWKVSASPREVALVESITGEVANRLGYSLDARPAWSTAVDLALQAGTPMDVLRFWSELFPGLRPRRGE